MVTYCMHRRRFFMTEIYAVPSIDVLRVERLVTRYKLLTEEFSSILQRQAFAVK